MTPNEITTLIASQLKKELDIPFKLMLDKRVQLWRARLMKNTLDKDARERKYFRQVIFVPMQPESEAACAPEMLSCKVAVNKVKIPSPMRANNILFDYVGGVNGMNPFQETQGGMVEVMSHGKYSRNIVRFTWAVPDIAVFGNPNLPMLRIEGIFEDPQEASRLSCKPGEDPCDYWNREYPVSGDTLQLIVQSIVSIDFQRGIIPDNADVPVAEEDAATVGNYNPRQPRPQQ